MLALDGVIDLIDGDKITNGIWINHEKLVVDPATGLVPQMFLGGDETKPVRSLVLSQNSPTVRQALRKKQRNGIVRMRAAPREDREQILSDSMTLTEEELFTLVFSKVENLSTSQAGAQTVDPASAKAIYEEPRLIWLVDQVLAACRDDGKYVSSGNAPAPAKPAKATPAPTEKTED